MNIAIVCIAFGLVIVGFLMVLIYSLARAARIGDEMMSERFEKQMNHETDDEIKNK